MKIEAFIIRNNKLIATKTMKRIYESLLKLDCAVLKSDSAITKVIKRKVLKPIGYFFRKKYFSILMNS